MHAAMSPTVIAVLVALVLVVIAVVALRRRGCTSTSQCTPPQVCASGKCVAPTPQPCSTAYPTGACPAGLECTAGACAAAHAGVLPRPTAAVVTDCGYNDPRWALPGWYDFSGQGVQNDFCRTVGGGPQPYWFSCALAGAAGQYTPSSTTLDPTAAHSPLAPGDLCYS